MRNIICKSYAPRVRAYDASYTCDAYDVCDVCDACNVHVRGVWYMVWRLRMRGKLGCTLVVCDLPPTH